MVTLNATHYESEDDIGGRARPLPGRYHMAIQHAEEKASAKKGTPGLQVEFSVVCDGLDLSGKAETKGQAGRTIPLFMSFLGGDDSKTATCISRVTRLAMAAGVITPGHEQELDAEKLIGRELVVEVQEGTYEDKNGATKTGSEVAFMGFWSLGNKEVVNVPKDPGSPGMQALAKGGTPPAPATASDGATAGAAQPAPAPAKRSKYADL